MREAGIADPEDDFLRYTARLSRPQLYDPASPTLGLPEWEYRQIRAIYESASPAAELLAERDALPYRWCEAVPDYWSELPEDKAPTGRVLVPEGARDSMSDGGVVGIGTMSAAAERDGVDIRVSHRVQRLVTGRRRRGGRGGDRPGRRDRAGAGAQGGDLRLGRLHARPGAAGQLPLRAGARRLRGADQRGRLRAHRGGRRRAAAQHEPGLDVPDPARARGGPAAGDVRDVLRGRRLDAVRRQDRPARGQREAAVQRAGPVLLPVGPAARRVPVPRARAGVGPARAGATRPPTSTGG